MSPPLDPATIRSIRGSRTQAEFAALLGVSPVTVYRWELPPGEGQSRSPRRAMRERILALAEAPSPTASILAPASRPPSMVAPTLGPGAPSTAGHPAADLAADSRPPTREPIAISSRRDRALRIDEIDDVLSLLDMVLQARWRDAEDAVLPHLHAGDACLGMRSFSQVVMSQVQLFERGDVRSALTSLQPALEADGRGDLPAWISVHVQVSGALIFSQPDGRVFHPGRVNLCAARAESFLPATGAEDSRGLLVLARFSAARGAGDARLATQVLNQGRPVLAAATSPLLKVLRTELRGDAAALEGRLVRARQLLGQAVDLAEEHGVPTARFRAGARLAWLDLLAGESHDQVRARLVRARRFADRARLTADVAEATLEATSADLLFRRGDAEGAAAALARARESQQARNWVSHEAIAVAARVGMLRQEDHELEALEALLDGARRNHALAGRSALDLYLRGMQAVRRRDYALATRTLLAAEADVREVGHPLELGLMAASLASYCALLSGDLGAQSEAARRAENALESFPAAWCGGVLALFQAMGAAVQGRTSDARLNLEAATRTFERSGDLVQLALLARVRGVVAWLTGEPDAKEALDASAERLEELDLPIPPALDLQALQALRERLQHDRAGRTTRGAEALAAREILVPLKRLSLRGQGHKEIAAELLEAVADLIHEDLGWVCELDSEGKATGFARRGPASDRTPQDTFEFGDGCGRRFRLGVVGPVPDPLRPVLQALAQVAGQAMEISALRSYADTGENTTRAPVPEVHGMVARSPAMRRVVDDLHRLRNSRATVLITGESGTGKEVVARALHKTSRRAKEAYVTFNCSTVPADLFEGQLFGYRKGAFTGATQDHLGVIRAADGGTLFLDEVGDLPLDLQPKLLRFLENAEVLPLGETRPRAVDVRVVAATHKDLAQLVRRGEFREDLFFRLQVVPIHLAPLRERPQDVVPLVQHFLGYQVEEGEAPPRLSPEVVGVLEAHSWPGNAREVRNVVDRAMAFSPVPRVLGPQHLRVA